MPDAPKKDFGLAVAAVATVGAALSAWAGDDLRQAAQNPVADLISLPFQNNTNFGVGKLDNTQNILRHSTSHSGPSQSRLELGHPLDHAGDLSASHSSLAIPPTSVLVI